MAHIIKKNNPKMVAHLWQNYINNNYPEIFTIADAKRGDVGNTSKMYAKSFFEQLNFDKNLKYGYQEFQLSTLLQLILIDFLDFLDFQWLAGSRQAGWMAGYR